MSQTVLFKAAQLWDLRTKVGLWVIIVGTSNSNVTAYFTYCILFYLYSIAAMNVNFFGPNPPQQSFFGPFTGNNFDMSGLDKSKRFLTTNQDMAPPFISIGEHTAVQTWEHFYSHKWEYDLVSYGIKPLLSRSHKRRQTAHGRNVQVMSQETSIDVSETRADYTNMQKTHRIFFALLFHISSAEALSISQSLQHCVVLMSFWSLYITFFHFSRFKKTFLLMTG